MQVGYFYRNERESCESSPTYIIWKPETFLDNVYLRLFLLLYPSSNNTPIFYSIIYNDNMSVMEGM